MQDRKKVGLWRFLYLLLALAGVALVLGPAYLFWLFVYDEYADPYRPDPGWPELHAVETDARQGILKVHPNVHVSSGNPTQTYFEAILSADPKDSQQLFAAAMSGQVVGRGIDGFRSRDGGQTWELALSKKPVNARGHLGDPTACHIATGEIILGYMHTKRRNKVINEIGTPGDCGLDFVISKDHGATWQELSSIDGYIDRPWIAVDRSNGKSGGTVYCIGNVNKPVFFSKRLEDSTFSNFQFPHPQAENPRPASNPLTLANGETLFAFRDNILVWNDRVRPAARPRIVVMSTADGGKTIEDLSEVDTRWSHPSLASRNAGILTMFPVIANNPHAANYANHVYSAWRDNADGDPNEERIFVGVSTDNGRSWAPPAVLSEQPMTAGSGMSYKAHTPAIAVNNDGIVAVSWYDRRGLPQSKKGAQPKGWNVRLRVSLDGGTSWLPSVQLNDQASTGPSSSVGHSMGVAAAQDGRFHICWIDDRTGTPQLWATTVEINVP